MGKSIEVFLLEYLSPLKKKPFEREPFFSLLIESSYSDTTVHEMKN